MLTKLLVEGFAVADKPSNFRFRDCPNLSMSNWSTLKITVSLKCFSGVQQPLRCCGYLVDIIIIRS